MKRKLVKRICVVGAESSGKSTLVNKLYGKYLTNSTRVQEAGRMLMSTPHLTREHFEDFALKQFSHIFLNDHRCTRPYQFIDTDIGITDLYCEEYLNLGFSLQVIERLKTKQKFDFYLVLAPNVKFVQDGLRIHEDQKKREEFFNKVLDYVQKSGVPYKVIDQSDYDERFNESVKVLESVFDIGEIK